MPGAEAMTALTPEADARLADYLRRVRAALSAAPDVDPAEVEADIREHVAAEFRDAPGPVGLAELDAVLVRLGPPAMWAGGGQPRLGWDGVVAGVQGLANDTKRAISRSAVGVVATLWRGPEDWRLAYLTFAVFGLFVWCIPQLNWDWTPLLLLGVAYILGRAAVSLAAQQGVKLGARRWLVYPPLMMVSLPLLLAAMLWPLGGGILAGEMTANAMRDVTLPQRVKNSVEFRDNENVLRQAWERANNAEQLLSLIPVQTQFKPLFAGVFSGIGLYALWGMIAGGVMWRYPGLPNAVFFPFLSGITSRHGLRLQFLSAVVFAFWCFCVYGSPRP